MSQFVGRRGGSFWLVVAISSAQIFFQLNDKASGLNQRQIASSADLGGSSNYSKETLATAFNFED